MPTGFSTDIGPDPHPGCLSSIFGLAVSYCIPHFFEMGIVEEGIKNGNIAGALGFCGVGLACAGLTYVWAKAVDPEDPTSQEHIYGSGLLIGTFTAFVGMISG